MTDKKYTPDLLGVETDYLQSGDNVIRKHTQIISQAFLDDLKDARNASKDQKEGEFMRVASIPVAVVEQWQREGFDIYQANAKEIVKRLREQGLDYFLATEKRV